MTRKQRWGGAEMLTCRVCGANCDPADLRDFVCDDCRDAARAKEEWAAKADYLARQTGTQISLFQMPGGLHYRYI